MAEASEETKSKILASAKTEKTFAYQFIDYILTNKDAFILLLTKAAVFIGNIQEFFHFGFMHLLGLPCDD